MSAAKVYDTWEAACAVLLPEDISALVECRCAWQEKPSERCAEKEGGRQFLAERTWADHYKGLLQHPPLPPWISHQEYRYVEKVHRYSKRRYSDLASPQDSEEDDPDPWPGHSRSNDQAVDLRRREGSASGQANTAAAPSPLPRDGQQGVPDFEDPPVPEVESEDEQEDEEDEEKDEEEELEEGLPEFPGEAPERASEEERLQQQYRDAAEAAWQRQEDEEEAQVDAETEAFLNPTPPPTPPPAPGRHDEPQQQARTPPLAEPRDRKLPPYLEQLNQWYQFVVKHKITDAAWEDLRALEAARDFLLPSKGVLTRQMMKLAGMRMKMYDVCPKGCVVYSDLMHGGETTCPWKTSKGKVCGAARYRELSKEEKESAHPPAHGKPILQVAYMLMEPWINAISANPTLAAEVFRWNKVTEDELKKPPAERTPHITDMNVGKLFQQYRTPFTDAEGNKTADPVLLNNHSISLANSTDSASFVVHRNEKEQVHAYFVILTILSASVAYRSTQSNVWRSMTLGPAHIQDVQSAVMPIVEEMLELEKPKFRYNGMTKQEEESNVGIGIEKRDTPELCAMCGHRGASATHSCPWCYRAGCLNALNMRTPAFLSCHDSTIPDVALKGIIPQPGEVTEPIELRSYSIHQQVVTEMEEKVLGGDPAAADKLGQQHGINNRGAFYELKMYQRGFPLINGADPMHIQHVCYTRDVLEIIFGVAHSKLGQPGFPQPITKQQKDIMDDLLLSSRQLKPPHMGSPLRSLSKFGNWHAWELRDFVTQDLGFLVAGLDLDPRLRDFIHLFIKVMQLLERLVPSTEPSSALASAFDFDSTAIRPDGLDVVPIDVLELLLNNLLVRGETLFYDRDPGFMKGITKPTNHRMVHFPLFYEYLGAGRNYSQNQLEGIIGTDKRAIGSRSNPIANLQRNQAHGNLSLLLRTLYDLPDLRPPNLRPPARFTSPRYPRYRFLHTREFLDLAMLPDLDRGAVELWCTSLGAGVGRPAVEAAKWGRLELPTGEEVRSGLWEKREWLPSVRVERAEGRRKGRAVGDTPNAVELSRDGTAKSARFVFATLDGETRLVEVGCYLTVSLLSEELPRMLALVDVFPTTKLHGMIVFDRALPRQRRVVDVKVLRCGARTHLLGVLDGKEMMGAVRKAGRNQVPLVV